MRQHEHEIQNRDEGLALPILFAEATTQTPRRHLRRRILCLKKRLQATKYKKTVILHEERERTIISAHSLLAFFPVGRKEETLRFETSRSKGLVCGHEHGLACARRTRMARARERGGGDAANGEKGFVACGVFGSV